MASGFYARADEIYRERLPEKHPSRFAQTYKHGLGLLAHGDLDGAARAFRQCIERAKATFGDAHPLIADAHQGLAVTAVHSGDLARARVELEMEAAVLRICFGESHPKVAFAHIALAAVCRARGELDDAQRHAELERAILGKTTLVSSKEIAAHRANWVTR